MADDKKYYYLKLKDNFFDGDEMIILESMPDGYMYSNILLKLYLRSLKNEGKLMFNEKIPYNPTILAQVTRHSVGVVEKALRIFQDLGLVEILDNGAIYMLDIQNFIGKSSTEADRKRAYRDKIEIEKGNKLIESRTNVTPTNGKKSGQMSSKCPDKTTPEIEIEIEKEIDIEIETEKKKDISSDAAFYDEDFKRVVQAFDQNIHPITPMEGEKLSIWMKDVEADVVIAAIGEAVTYNKRSYGYINAILRNWHKSNITTMDGLNAYLRDRRDKQNGSDNSNTFENDQYADVKSIKFGS